MITRVYDGVRFLEVVRSTHGMASDKAKIKEAVIPKLISGVSKVFEQTLLEELGDSPCSSSSIAGQVDRPRNLLTLNRGVCWAFLLSSYYYLYQTIISSWSMLNSTVMAKHQLLLTTVNVDIDPNLFTWTSHHDYKAVRWLFTPVLFIRVERWLPNLLHCVLMQKRLKYSKLYINTPWGALCVKVLHPFHPKHELNPEC